MKMYRAWGLVAAILIAISVMPVQGASARATFTQCEATLTVVGFTEGAITSPGANTHIRGRVVRFRQVSANPLCSGDITAVVNYNLDSNGEGPKWGTFTWEAPPDGPYTGGFEGTFSGWAEQYTQVSWVRPVGRGYGDLQGLKLHEYIDLDLTREAPQGSATLTILDPQGE
ncbi:MAG: hypothetical protein R6X31_07030 [Anaerolineae bacterium]